MLYRTGYFVPVNGDLKNAHSDLFTQPLNDRSQLVVQGCS